MTKNTFGCVISWHTVSLSDIFSWKSFWWLVSQDVIVVCCYSGMWLVSVFPLAVVSLRRLLCGAGEHILFSSAHWSQVCLTIPVSSDCCGQRKGPVVATATWALHHPGPWSSEFGERKEAMREVEGRRGERGEERRVWNEFNKKRIGKSVKSVNGEMKEDETEREWRRKWSQCKPDYQEKDF